MAANRMERQEVTQEQKITFLLLNFMALEGAIKHFNASSPPSELFELFKAQMKAEHPPAYWKAGGYTANLEISDQLPAFEYSWRCLKGIRNNLFHANKAREPDMEERLDFLLDWSSEFIKTVYATNGDLAQKALAVKKALKITSV